jgi:hypothetical protein
MNSSNGTAKAVGFPIRKSPDQSLLGNSPKLFAAYHVLHRLLVPRHPPYALSSLLTRRRLSTWQNQSLSSRPGKDNGQLQLHARRGDQLAG